MKKTILYAGLGLIMVCLVSALMSWALRPQIGFVRSDDLIHGYEGWKEGFEKYQAKTKLWQGNIDSLKADFQRSYYSSQGEAAGKNNGLLQAQEENIFQYSKTVEQLMNDEEKRLLEGVLNQINSFVVDYGKKEGFDIIFGTTESGSIMYGREGIDLTEKVLEGLNRKYGDGEK